MFSKTNQTAQPSRKKLTISVQNYTNDKIQYGVPIKRSEAKRANIMTSAQQTQHIDINMDYRPYKPAGRLSFGSLEDRPNPLSSHYLSDLTCSEYSSDNESGRFSLPLSNNIQYDAQRTSAFSQAASASEKKIFSSPNIQNKSMGAGNVSNSRLKLLWNRHKFRIVVLCLILWFILFTSYDVYFTTREQKAKQAMKNSSTDILEDPSSAELQNHHRGAKHKKSMYETDPDLIWDDSEQRQYENE